MTLCRPPPSPSPSRATSLYYYIRYILHIISNKNKTSAPRARRAAARAIFFLRSFFFKTVFFYLLLSKTPRFFGVVSRAIRRLSACVRVLLCIYFIASLLVFWFFGIGNPPPKIQRNNLFAESFVVVEPRRASHG